MIIDRTWNSKEQKLTISYVDKKGQRQLFTKYLHHIKTYEYNENGDLETWNGRKCKRVFKDTSTYKPNDFDIFEFMYELDAETLKLFHAQYFPKLYFFDIENFFVPGEKPDPEGAKYEVNAISLVGPDLSCIVYGLKNLSEEKKELLKKRYLDWIENNEFAKKTIAGKEPKVLFQYFSNERDLLNHWFKVILPKISCLAAWNCYGYDWPYLINRYANLFGRNEMLYVLRLASPTRDIRYINHEDMKGDRVRYPIPAHMLVLDYQVLVDDYDRVIDPKESLSLDWIAEHAIAANKIEHEESLDELYENDPDWYYYYNAIDSCIGQLLHHRLKCLKSPASVSSYTLVPFFDAMGQVALTTANIFKEFYDSGKHVVWDYDAVARVKIPYEGAFCGCEPGRYELNVCDDFASLYPSQIITCNFSFENFYEKRVGPDSLGRYTTMPWSDEEIEEFKKDPNFFVSDLGNVYKNDQDYAFRRAQMKLMGERAKYKYTGQKIDAELLTEIDRLIAEKKKQVA